MCIAAGTPGEGLCLLDELETVVPQLLDAVHDGLYQRAKRTWSDHTKGVPDSGRGQGVHGDRGRLRQDHVVRDLRVRARR